jgi:prolyl-tRNA synthetase
MKDLYSFDENIDKAQETYEEVADTYEKIFKKIQVPVLKVAADAGNIGGNLSHEFHVVSPAGEDTLLKCTICSYAANQEKAAGAVASDQFDFTVHAKLLQSGVVSDTMKADPRSIGLFDTISIPNLNSNATSSTASGDTSGISIANNANKSNKDSKKKPTNSKSAESTAEEVDAKPSGMNTKSKVQLDQEIAVRSRCSSIIRDLTPAGLRSDVPMVVNIVVLNEASKDGSSVGHDAKNVSGNIHANNNNNHNNKRTEYAIVMMRADRELNPLHIKSYRNADSIRVMSADEAAITLFRYRQRWHNMHRKHNQLHQQVQQKQLQEENKASAAGIKSVETSAEVNIEFLSDLEATGNQAEIIKYLTQFDNKRASAGVSVIGSDSSSNASSDIDFGQEILLLADSSLVPSHQDIDLPDTVSANRMVLPDLSEEAGAQASASVVAYALEKEEKSRENSENGSKSSKRDSKSNLSDKDEKEMDAQVDKQLNDSNQPLRGSVEMISSPIHGEFSLSKEGDKCIQSDCKGFGRLEAVRGIEVGHVFYLGTKYSEPMNATIKVSSKGDISSVSSKSTTSANTSAGGDSNTAANTAPSKSKKIPIEMGCYGIGVSRLVAAVIESKVGHDNEGITWPVPIAPFALYITAIGKQAPSASPKPPTSSSSSNTNNTFAGLGRLPNAVSGTVRKANMIDLENEANRDVDGLSAKENSMSTIEAIRTAKDVFKVAEQLSMLVQEYVPNLRNDVMLDDRFDLGVGTRLKDAFLVGFPYIVIVGRAWSEGLQKVEVIHRTTGLKKLMTVEELILLLSPVSSDPTLRNQSTNLVLKQLQATKEMNSSQGFNHRNRMQAKQKIDEIRLRNSSQHDQDEAEFEDEVAANSKLGKHISKRR